MNYHARLAVKERNVARKTMNSQKEYSLVLPHTKQLSHDKEPSIIIFRVCDFLERQILYYKKIRA